MDLIKKTKSLLKNLHPDLVSNVFHFLSHEEILKTRLVCKQYKKIIEEHPTVFHTIVINTFKNLHVLNKILGDRTNFVKRLVIKEGIEIHGFELFLKRYRFPNLVKLEVHSFKNEILEGEDIFRLIKENFPKLKSLVGLFRWSCSGGMMMKDEVKDRPKIQDLSMEEIVWGFTSSEGGSAGSISRGSMEERAFIIGDFKKLKSFEGVVTSGDLTELSKTNTIEKLKIKLKLHPKSRLNEDTYFHNVKKLRIGGVTGDQMDDVLRFCHFPNLEDLELHMSHDDQFAGFSLSGGGFFGGRSIQKTKTRKLLDLNSFLTKNINLSKIKRFKTDYSNDHVSSEVMNMMTSLTNFDTKNGQLFFSISQNREILKNITSLRVNFNVSGKIREISQLNEILSSLKSVRTLYLSHVDFETIEITDHTNPDLRSLDLCDCNCKDETFTIRHESLEKLQIYGRELYSFSHLRINTPKLSTLQVTTGRSRIDEIRIGPVINHLSLAHITLVPNIEEIREIKFLAATPAVLCELSKLENFSQCVKRIRLQCDEQKSSTFGESITSYTSLETLIVADYGGNVRLFSESDRGSLIKPLESVTKLSMQYTNNIDLEYLSRKFPCVESVYIHSETNQSKYSQTALFYMDEIYSKDILCWKGCLKHIHLDFDRIGFRQRSFMNLLLSCFSETLESFKIEVRNQRSWKRPNNVRRNLNMKKLKSLKISYPKLDYLIEELESCEALEAICISLEVDNTSFSEFRGNLDRLLQISKCLKHVYVDMKMGGGNFQSQGVQWKVFGEEVLEKLVIPKKNQDVYFTFKLPTYDDESKKLAEKYNNNQGCFAILIDDYMFELRKKLPVRPKKGNQGGFGGFGGFDAYNKSVLDSYNMDEDMQYMDEGDDVCASNNLLGNYNNFVRDVDNRSENMLQKFLEEQEREEKERKKKNEGKACVACGKSHKAMKICSRCKKTYYCSRDCQVKHWKVHKKKCKK